MPLKNKEINEEVPIKNPVIIRCICKTRMEFIGVDGNGGIKYYCPNCYQQIVIKEYLL